MRPNFYGTRRAIANFFFESTLELVAGDRLVLIRPLNFAYYDRTLMVKRFMTVAQHGLGVPGQGTDTSLFASMEVLILLEYSFFIVHPSSARGKTCHPTSTK